MAFPYLAVFGVLFLVYMGYSFWARLDPRYPIGAGLVLLVATALTEALGASPAAATLAEYVFVLLTGGVVLMLLDRVRTASGPMPTGDQSREASGVPEEQPPHPTDEGQGPPEHPLDHLKEQPVPPVDAAGGHDDQDEQSGHPES
jgi:hypothetical protein